MDKQLCFTLLKTGIPFGIINILNYLYFRFIPVALVRHHLTDVQFSVFDISFRIALVLSLFSTFFMFSVMPVFKKSLTAKNWQFLLLFQFIPFSHNFFQIFTSPAFNFLSLLSLSDLNLTSIFFAFYGYATILDGLSYLSEDKDGTPDNQGAPTAFIGCKLRETTYSEIGLPATITPPIYVE